MDAPPVQYATTSDGYSIAYAVSGSGPPLVFMASIFDHVQMAWQYPGLDEWLPGLAQRFRLIQLDTRGTGMSSRKLPDDLNLTHYEMDLEAVLERLGLRRFVLFALDQLAVIAVKFAVEHPDRLTALVITPVSVTLAGQPTAVCEVLTGQDWDLFLRSLVPFDRTLDEAMLRVNLMKQGVEQQQFIDRMRVVFEQGDMTELLPRLKTPTLVLHARDYRGSPPAQAVEVAHLAGAQIVLLDGSNALGDANQGIRAIEAFLAGLPSERPVLGNRLVGLSSRELDVLRLVAAGRSNPQIADELVISLNTARKHVGNILGKTGTGNRTEAAGYARDHGLA